jgi:hypothetical protein
MKTRSYMYQIQWNIYKLISIIVTNILLEKEEIINNQVHLKN